MVQDKSVPVCCNSGVMIMQGFKLLLLSYRDFHLPLALVAYTTFQNTLMPFSSVDFIGLETYKAYVRGLF